MLSGIPTDGHCGDVQLGDALGGFRRDLAEAEAISAGVSMAVLATWCDVDLFAAGLAQARTAREGALPEGSGAPHTFSRR